MTKLTDVARRAGVSVSTASSVLNPGSKPKFVSEAITARVKEAAQELGYVSNYHARSMKLRRAMAIAVTLDVLPEHATPRAELGSSYFGTLFGSVAIAARHLGFSTAIIGADPVNRATWRGAHAVQQRQLDGLVVLAMTETSHSDSFYTHPPDMPVVAIEPSVKTTTIPSVQWDVPAAIDDVMNHLAQLGHRQIMWVGPESVHGTTPSAIREMLLMRSVWDRGFKGKSVYYRQDYSRSVTSVGAAFFLDPAYAAVKKYLSEKGIGDHTAIVCYNDATALGVMHALREAGISVPGDVSVLGFDDIEAEFSMPKLTSVRMPLEKMGERAMQLLVEMVEDHSKIATMKNHRELLKSQLVVRESTGPARSA